MSRDLEIVSITTQDQSVSKWSDLISELKKNVGLNYIENNNSIVGSTDVIKALIKEKDIVLVDQSLRIHISKIVNHRSVRSHFLQYFDYLEKRNNQWWGCSLYSDIFYQVLLGGIKNQDYKGAVIFLGVNPVTLPILEVLTGFGFEDFVFLNSADDKGEIESMISELKGFIGAQFSIVDSTTFIQSQKEYSLCFVMKDLYSKQILDDMSYFHFLSSQSMVFDIVGSSNFLFKEVKALGVEVVEFERVQEHLVQVYAAKIRQYLKDVKIS